MDEELEFYGEYYPYLIECKQNMEKSILDINEENKQDTGHSLMEHYKARIKSAESMLEKLEKRQLSQTREAALSEVTDVIGVRIICRFLTDIYSLRERIAQKFEVIKEKNYIEEPKENGYRSLHLILKVPCEVMEQGFLYVEIQIRTIAMDCWASLEHQMKYKKNIKNTKLIVHELKRCADEMASTDLTMQTIRELIEQE